MAYRFQFRGDVETAWENIILADREIGILQKKDNGKLVNTNLYKIGDGKTPWKDLPYFGFSGTFSESLNEVAGEQSSNMVVSKAVLVAKFDEVETAYEAADTALSGRIDGAVAAYEAADTALSGRITTLEGAHVIVSENDWDPESAKENTFYYIYEETKE